MGLRRLLPRWAARALLLAGAVALAACGRAVRWEQPAAATSPGPVRQETGQPPRSARGNPPFYDVMGRRYYVLASSEGYRERGVASWYGRDFHGKPTSSGKRYDMYAMTAAHKTLPLPTRVRVTNLRNGRSAIVTVNDRGPFVDNRLIDLSYAAAVKLDMIRNGTALVEVEALSATPPPVVQPAGMQTADAGTTPATRPGKTAAAQAAAPASPAVVATRSVFLQVGAFGQPGNALQLKHRLEASGLANVMIHFDGSVEPALYRVRVGPIADVDEYDELIRRVSGLEIRDAHLVTETTGEDGHPATGPTGLQGGG